MLHRNSKISFGINFKKMIFRIRDEDTPRICFLFDSSDDAVNSFNGSEASDLLKTRHLG